MVHCAAVRALRGITPRVGGEKPFLFCGGSSDSGSPPHRRGKGVNVNCSADDIGITPAWAGKRSQVAAALQSGWDHPRIGGEKSGLHRKRPHQRGSPPRGRGKVEIRHQITSFHRITPAWAGKSRPTTLGWVLARGSPPRGRGKDAVQGWMRATEGITPAWAGKRSRAGGHWTRRGDHPRTGGEKFSSLTLFGL